MSKRGFGRGVVAVWVGSGRMGWDGIGIGRMGQERMESGGMG